jgi:primary-amine oxidase
MLEPMVDDVSTAIMIQPHPLDRLSVGETNQARDIVLNARGKSVVEFRSIYLNEPPKAELVRFLEAEHNGQLDHNTPRPTRMARLQYDVVHYDKSHEYAESIVDLNSGRETLHRIVDRKYQPSLTTQVCQEPT